MLLINIVGIVVVVVIDDDRLKCEENDGFNIDEKEQYTINWWKT